MPSVLLAVVPLLLTLGLGKAAPDQEASSLARQALGTRLGANPDEIQVLQVTPVRWADPQASCAAAGAPPRPEAPANGHRLLLRAGNRVYRVHVGAGRAVVCGHGLRPAAAPSPVGTEGGEVVDRPPVPLPAGEAQRKLVEEARDDLARRLSLPLAEIRLVEFQAVMWPDSSLGCPRPGMMYTQVVRKGFRIGLRAGKRTFDYHSGGGRVFLCEEPAPK
jgi:hypothetical protein